MFKLGLSEINAFKYFRLKLNWMITLVLNAIIFWRIFNGNSIRYQCIFDCNAIDQSILCRFTDWQHRFLVKFRLHDPIKICKPTFWVKFYWWSVYFEWNTIKWWKHYGMKLYWMIRSFLKKIWLIDQCILDSVIRLND